MVLSGLALQRAQGFFVHVPFFQNSEDGLGAEAAACQLPENASRLLFILWLHHPLSPEIFASLLFFTYTLESRVDSLVDDITVYPFHFQIGHDAQAAEFLI